MESSKKRIAIIGAGPAGLSTLKVLQEHFLAKEPTDYYEIVCYEGSDQPGGEWVNSLKKPDTSQYGFPIQSSTYEDMQANIFTHDMELSLDFRFPDHVQSFPMRRDVLKYFQDYAEHFQLLKFIKFSHLVTSITRSEQVNGNKLCVQFVDLSASDSKTNEDIFDFIFMCCGQHRKPLIPEEYDLSKFNGEVLHYHNMYDPSRFANKQVLIVGGSSGAMDLVITLSKICRNITVSWHRHKPSWGYDASINMKPAMTRAEGKMVHFVDGSSLEDVDAILYATGFLHNDPLAKDLALDFSKSSTLFPLYKGVVHPACGNVFFVGKQASMIVSGMRFHAEFGAAVIDGRVKLPSQDEMIADIERKWTKWTPILAQSPFLDWTKYCPVYEMDSECIDILADMTQIPRQRRALLKSYYALVLYRRDDVFNFRRYKLAKNVDDESVDAEHSLTLGN